MFPICIVAPSFKKEGFGPEPLQKEKLCQNCEFFPEIFRHLSVQTGFLLATIRVGYLVAFENPTGPAEYSGDHELLLQHCPGMQSFVVPLSLCPVLYLFYSPGGGSVTPKQGGIHPSMELMELRGHQ